MNNTHILHCCKRTVCKTDLRPWYGAHLNASGFCAALNGPLQQGDTATGCEVTWVACTDHSRTDSHPAAESNGPTIVGWLPPPGDHKRNHHANRVAVMPV